MVLATVADIIYVFTGFYIGSAVFIQGTTLARTRRYQMGINKYWQQINAVFNVLGLKNETWHPFKKAENYEAFIGSRKSTLLQ